MNENEKNKYNIEIGSIIRNYRKNKKITQIKKRVPALTLFPLFYCRFFLSRD